ncbi:hypothetical protein VPH35_107488 [Triticum aestivum]
MVRPEDDPRFEASLCLPPDALELLSSGNTHRPPSPSSSSWALLESLAYMVPPGGVRNRTTAQTLMPDGRTTIEVTFLLADPPRRSYWCISVCPDSASAAHSHSDPPLELVLDSIPKIVSSAEDLALIQVGLTTCKHLLWLVYSASARGLPSLALVPDIHDDHQPLMEPYGISTSTDSSNNGFVLAALSYNYEVDAQYDLHLYSYVRSTWTCNRRRLAVDYRWTRKPHRVCPDKVIALGDGLLGWVDLWEGILICDVVKDDPKVTARFVPMPTPLPGNQDLRQGLFLGAVAARRHLRPRLHQIEQLLRPKPKATPVVHDPSTLLLLFDSQSAMVPEKVEYEVVGWRLITWFRALTWGHWQRGTILHSDQLGNIVSWKDLQTCTPVLSPCDGHDKNAVYLMSMLKNRRPQDETAWMIQVDTNTKSLPHEPMPFSTDRSSPNYPNLIPCALTTYLMP